MRLGPSWVCHEDIRKDLYAMLVLPGGFAVFQGIGEQMAIECNVSCAKDFLSSVTVSVEVSLGAKLAPAEGECWIAHRLDTVTLCAHLIEHVPSSARDQRHHDDRPAQVVQWFEHVTWDCINDLCGTTYVQPPTRFRFALQQAQHASLRAIIHNNPNSPASESAWKALILSSWLLLG